MKTSEFVVGKVYAGAKGPLRKLTSINGKVCTWAYKGAKKQNECQLDSFRRWATKCVGSTFKA